MKEYLPNSLSLPLKKQEKHMEEYVLAGELSSCSASLKQ